MMDRRREVFRLHRLRRTHRNNSSWQASFLSRDWSGATSNRVDIYRNGALIVTTRNDGFYTDRIGGHGPGTFTYQVCNAGTGTCSNQETVTF
jgi:hypothetical protein